MFDVSGKKVTIASSQTSGVRAGTRLYILKDGKEVGQGRVGNVFHTKVEMTLTGGVAEKGLLVTDKSPGTNNKPTPTGAQLIDNGNGTIADKVNHLVWKKCSEGQNNDAQCTGYSVSTVFCKEADNSCNGGDEKNLLNKGPLFAVCDTLNANGGFGGKSGWRVPTIEELRTLVQCGKNNNATLAENEACPEKSPAPAINQMLFPNTKHENYWSATPYQSSPTIHAWAIFFGNGAARQFFKAYTNAVRCVRKGG